MTDLVTFEYDGSHFMVRRRVVSLLKRGWRVRFTWRREYDNSRLRHLSYLVTSSRWGIGGSAHEPDYYIRRVGPFYLDRLSGPKPIVIALMQARAAIKWFVDRSQQEAQRAYAAETTLRELQARTPSLRGGAC